MCVCVYAKKSVSITDISPAIITIMELSAFLRSRGRHCENLLCKPTFIYVRSHICMYMSFDGNGDARLN